MSYDFRHGARASIWHEIAARSHLVVAAVGTVVFLGMAGSAIWMALPSEKAAAVARKAEPIARPAATATQATANASAVSGAAPVPRQDPVQNSEELRAQTAGTRSETKTERAAAANFGPLEQGDPRWIAPDGKDVKAAVKAAAGKATEDTAVETMANAFAEDDDAGPADAAPTAAIPAMRPEVEDAAEDADKGAEPQAKADATRESRTLRAVTMRAKPSSRGSVLGTVPGRATVEVISCQSWCEIVYNGKQGFVYKGFLRNGGR